MAVYHNFAPVYDRFMRDTPYDDWASYIDRLIRGTLVFNEPKKPLVLDLGCGTGNMTLRLAKKGYEMIGVDVSPDMLCQAQEKAFENGADILFLAQDMCKLDLYGTVDVAVSVCDGLNYITDREKLAETFRRVAKFMNPGGVFIFDMNTEYKFQQLGDRSYTDVDGDASYLWKNHYAEDTRMNEYIVTFFVKEANGQQRHFSETHQQRAYPTDTVELLLRQAGFASLRICDAYSDKLFSSTSERLTFIARL